MKVNKRIRHTNRHELTSKRFGRLTVLSIAKRDKFGSIFWLCRCDCGNQTVVKAHRLLTGYTKSCNCLRLSMYNPTDRPGGLVLLFARYRHSAAKRGYSFSLSEDEMRAMFTSPCWYCGAPPSHISRRDRSYFVYNGIDRLDNSKGYEKDNCVPCCGSDNFLKGDMPAHEFIARCAIIGAKHLADRQVIPV